MPRKIHSPSFAIPTRSIAPSPSSFRNNFNGRPVLKCLLHRPVKRHPEDGEGPFLKIVRAWLLVPGEREADFRDFHYLHTHRTAIARLTTPRPEGYVFATHLLAGSGLPGYLIARRTGGCAGGVRSTLSLAPTPGAVLWHLIPHGRTNSTGAQPRASAKSRREVSWFSVWRPTAPPDGLLPLTT